MKKVLKPQKGEPEELAPQSRQISITQLEKDGSSFPESDTHKSASGKLWMHGRFPEALRSKE